MDRVARSRPGTVLDPGRPFADPTYARRVSTPTGPAPHVDTGVDRRNPADVTDELDQPRPAPPVDEPGRETGATASERATAQTAAELSGR